MDIHKKNKYKVKRSSEYLKGLTLVELMVVIGIFLMITTIAIFNYGNFNSNVSLQNLTDDIALAVRKAQGYAIGARGIAVGSETNFSNSYGMHFSSGTNPDNPLDGSNKSFILFSIPISPQSEKKYEPGDETTCGGESRCIELFNIVSADIIKSISLTINDQVTTPPTESAYLDIVFTRPDTRAYFCFRPYMSALCSGDSISKVDIDISNGLIGEKERIKTISIQNTGQISISIKDDN